MLKTNNTSFDISGLVKLRINKGYTQYDVSIMTGIPEKHISKIEQGKVIPNIIEIIQITESLGLELKLSVINKFTYETKEISLRKKN